MDTDLLKTFLEVNRTRHFGRAADNLFITPSAVSARVKLLEEQLGVELFVRERNNIRLTPAGERLVGHAGALLGAWERTRQEMAIGEHQLSPLMVGATPGMWESALSAWAATLLRDAPHLALRAEALTSEAIIHALRRNQLDVGFLYEPPALPELELREMRRIALNLYSRDAALDQERALAAGYLLVDWGSTFLHRHATLFPGSPPPAARLPLPRLAMELLARSGGSAYLSDALVAESRFRDDLHRVAGAPTIHLTLFALFPADHPRRAVVEEALGHFA